MADDLDHRYVERLPLLNALSAALEQETRDALAALQHVDRVSFRTKSLASFITKAADARTEPPYSDPLVEIEDQVAGRVIVFFVDDIARVEEALSGTFTTVERSHRRPLRDEEFGYESRHIIYVIPPHLEPSAWSDRDSRGPLNSRSERS